MSENNEHELQQWAEQFYAKMVEEKQAEEEPSMLDQLFRQGGRVCGSGNRESASRGAGSCCDEIGGNGRYLGGCDR